MLKSVLATLLVYFLSCFKFPRFIIIGIEKIQRHVLWNDSHGGLGIHLIGNANRALLRKWLW